MRTLYLDLVGGAAGDMLMAALIDLGAPASAAEAAVAALELDGVELQLHETQSAGLRARRADVKIHGQLADTTPDGHDHHHDHGHGHDHHGHDHHGHGHDHHGHGDDHGHEHGHHGHGHDHVHHDHAHGHHSGHGHRPYPEIVAKLEAAALPAGVRRRALAVFARLAAAEGAAHGVPVEQVVLHEVGADDAMVDIVGVSALVEALAPDRIVVSPLPLGSGLTMGAHGPIPLPAPATLAVLLGAPTRQVPLRGETVTPTGAALIMELADDFGPIPSLQLEAVGTGAGHRSWPDRPNVVRALLGQTTRAPEQASERVVETNLDDLSPEALPGLFEALLAAGALDVWAQPIHMKKGRPGLLVGALGSDAVEAQLVQAFLTHSGSLGVRSYAVCRHRAPRELWTVHTIYGPVTVKRSERPDGSALYKPEHDDCARLAAEAQVSLRRVQEAALRAAWAGEGE